jgi:hypothetical protein
MIETIASQLGGMPREGVIALLVLLSLQAILQVLALIDLARRRTVRGGRKWVWALVIIGGTLVGALAYLVIGRQSETGDSEPDPGRGDLRGGGEDALDRLYGPRSGEKAP